MKGNELLSEQEILHVLSLSESATAIYSFNDFIIESVNNAMLALWGKDKTVIGQPVLKAVPQLKGQSFENSLQEVCNTGVTKKGVIKTELKTEGKVQVSYCEYTCQAIRNNKDKIYCILHTAHDITEFVRNKDILNNPEAPGKILDRETETLNLARNKLLRLKTRLHKHSFKQQDDLAESETVSQKLNEELSATNEELISINEEITATNEKLVITQNELINLNISLASSEKRFRLLIENLPVAINMFHSRDLVIDMPNDKMLEIWGRTATDVVGKPLDVAMPELKGQPFMKRLDEVIVTGKAYYSKDEKAYIYRNGMMNECYFNIVYQPIINEDGSVTSLLQIASEVTDEVNARKQVQELNEELAVINEELSAVNEEQNASNEELLQSQNDLFVLNKKLNDANEVLRNSEGNLIYLNQKLGDSETRFRLMAEGTGILIAAGENITRATYFNSAWTELTGRSREDLIKKGWEDLIHTDDRERYHKIYTTAFETKQPFTIEYRLITAAGDDRWLLCKGHPRFLPDGSFAGYISSGIDITDKKKDEQRKNDFIGMVSHELKTPLTSISGYLEMLEMNAGDIQDQYAFGLAERANKQVRKMVGLINSFLNISRLESAKIQINKARFDMARLMKEAQDESAIIYNRTIVFNTAENVYVNADFNKIEQVINNFISNAIKYSSLTSTIFISCKRTGNNAQISVQDEGIGIKAEHLPKLFDRYYRVDDDNTTSPSGFGIGLYLCAEIIHRHEGSIWVESQPGKGSTFYFSLPAIA